jgi:hypothetical protein
MLRVGARFQVTLAFDGVIRGHEFPGLSELLREKLFWQDAGA